MNGSESEAIDFMNWFCDLPYRHKIFICGNHDECLYGANITGLDKNVHYLCNSRIEIEGIKFYGVPLFLNDCITEYQYKNYSKIPADIDVLVTHSPPYGIMDFDGVSYGSRTLLKKTTEIAPKLHLFGHIHKQHGIRNITGRIFSNGAIMNERYNSIQHPNIIEI